MKTIKKIALFIITFMIFFTIKTSVYAVASTTITPTSTSVTKGTTVNIAVGVNSAEVWILNLSASGGNLGGTTSSEETPGSETTKTVMNATFSATTAGTYTITLSGEIAGSDLVKQAVNKQITITVTEPEPSPTPTTAPTTAPTTEPPKAPELTFTAKNETVYATSDVNVRSSYSTSSNALGQLKQGESVVRTGVSNEKADGNYWSQVKFNGQTAYVASGFLSTNPPEIASPKPTASPDADEKSHDSSLSELTIKDVEFTPTFNSAITTYNASVKADVTSVKVTAKANDTKATVEITGADKLNIGENVVTVKVTAEDETTTEYKIKVTKGEETIPTNAIVLTGIRENGQKIAVTLEKPNITDNKVTYTVNLKEKLKSIEIIGTLSDEKYSYEGLGIFDLKEGDNEYKVTLKQTGANDVEYILKVNYVIEQAAATQEGTKANFKVIAIVVVVTIAVIASVFAFLHFKGKNKVNYGNPDYSFLRNDSENKDNDIYKFNYNDDNNGNDDFGDKKSGKHF